MIVPNLACFVLLPYISTDSARKCLSIRTHPRREAYDSPGRLGWIVSPYQPIFHHLNPSSLSAGALGLNVISGIAPHHH